MAISAGVESTVTATTATQKERNKKQTTHQAQKQLSKRLLSVCMANREGKEGWPISAVVRADWHAFTQNQVPEVEWGAEDSLRWVRWVGSLGVGVAVAQDPTGIITPKPEMCWDPDPSTQKTAGIHWDPAQKRHDPR